MLARRTVLKGLAGGVAGLPLAVVLTDPELARAAAKALDADSLTTPGGRTVNDAHLR